MGNNNILNNEEERKKAYNQIFDQRTIIVYKENFKLKEKSISYDDFVKLVTEKKSDSFFKGLNPFK